MAMPGYETLVDRYELRGVLGRGGMAEVRDGWDHRLDRAVAVKLLHPGLSHDPDVRRRFEDEARAAAALSHPNIVSVYDCGVDDQGRPFIVMERLPGDSLHDHIAQGPLPPHRVRAILTDVLAALSVAHTAGVLHRDIKPGNILVADDGTTMKVADFGIAKTVGAAHTMTGQIVGTMAYMSPERIAGASASVADDLYAVGVIGYEALVGRRAYPQDNPAILVRAITGAPLTTVTTALPGVDPILASVIDRAMTRDPRQRFQTAEQMQATLNGHRAATAVVPASAQSAPRPATKILDEPLPGVPATVTAPDADYYVPARRRTLSRNQIFLAAAGLFAAFVVAMLALVVKPSSVPDVTEPVSTSTPVPVPSSAAPPPPSVTTPVVQPDEKKVKKPKGGNGNGHGNGHAGNRPG